MKKNIAIFASGGGSNAEKIMSFFDQHKTIQVKVVVTNNAKAGVLEKAKHFQVESVIINAKTTDGNQLLQLMQDFSVDFIVLAGYLKKIPNEITAAFKNKIVNVHPALLPKFGGPGMYGSNVHRAVVEAKEKISGMTIHYVNDNYDEGAIIEQHTCELTAIDTPEMVAEKVLKLEHEFFAPCIEKLIENEI